MRLCILTVPLASDLKHSDPLDSLQEGFEITRYEHYFVDLAEGPAIAVVAAVRERADGRARPGSVQRTSRKEITASLNDTERDLFERLRAWRKLTAKEEGLPVYAVANNKQLAEMARLQAPSKSKLGDIASFSRKKVDRYGDPIIALLTRRETEDSDSKAEGDGE